MMNPNSFRRALLFSFLLTLFLLFVWQRFALAQDTPPTEATSPAGELSLMLLKIVASVFGILAIWLTTKGIKYVEGKTKIDIPAAAETMIFEWVDKGIGLAHEKSHQQVKKLGKKLGGSEKLNIALEFVKAKIEENDLDTIAEQRLVDYIEAKLGLKRQDETNTLPSAEPTSEGA